MIKHAWTVVCEKSIVDRDTNNISLDVIEQLNFRVPPIPEDAEGVVIPFKLEVVSLWFRGREDPGTIERARIRTIAPNGEDVGVIDVDVDLKTFVRSRTRCVLASIPVPKGESGIFRFVVETESGKKWSRVADVPVEVFVKQESDISS